jgi:transcriptional regulator with XRE-family HTH domain/phage repressor protein C with HTH and peptisase S24 domain
MLKTNKQKNMSKIKILRKRQGLTLEDLSGATGISVSYLSRIEAGSRRLNADTLSRIAGSLRCHPADLLDDVLPKREDAASYDAPYGYSNIPSNWVSNPRAPSALDQTMAQFYPMIAGMNNQSRAALLRHALTLSIAQIGGAMPADSATSGNNPSENNSQDTYGGKNQSPLSALQELPVYTQGVDSSGAQTQIDFKNPTRWILRPAELIGVPTAFALEVTTNQLEPKYRAGDIILINPTRTLSPGCSSIILKKDNGILVKEYINKVDDKVILREFGSHAADEKENQLEISNSELQSMYRIIGSIENAA